MSSPKEPVDYAGVALVTFVVTLMISSALALVAGVSYSIYKWITAEDVVTHCYVKRIYDGSGYIVVGNVEWREDRYIDRGNNLDEALDSARKYGCEVK